VTDVYRCGSGDAVYDPCWRDNRAHGLAVVCFLAPWDTRVYRLILGRDPGPAPRATGTAALRASPWGIEVAAGVRCLELQGAHATVDGKGSGAVIDYGCANGISLVRGVDRSRAVWRARAVRCGATPPCSPVGLLPITTAWFGGNDPVRVGSGTRG
jgi:hypothetical protein